MKSYIETDQQLHLLSQTLAKVNRTYISPLDDDSHTNIFFDELTNSLAGRWIYANHKKYRLSIDLKGFRFVLSDDFKHKIGAVKIQNNTQEDIENELYSLFLNNQLIQNFGGTNALTKSLRPKWINS